MVVAVNQTLSEFTTIFTVSNTAHLPVSWQYEKPAQISRRMNTKTMNNQVLVECRVFKKIQVWVESGSGPRKTLPENSCITSEVIHRHKGLEYVSTTMPTFQWPQSFSAF